MVRRILPHPLLTLLLAVVWMLLENTFSAGVLVFGLVVGLIIPIVTSAYWPDRPRLSTPIGIVRYVLIVIWDIVVANVVVAWTVLFKSNADMKPTWVSIPLDIRTPEAITILAGTITLTPGTVTADLSSEGHSLLVHCLDADDADAVRDQIKERYERRLKEIFE
jgi:multicomponent K+:H+ antiporter subunit E